MRKRFLAVLTAMALLSGLLAMATPAAAEGPSGISHMPPNPEKILATLIARGQLPANATKAEQEATLQRYLQTKLKDGGPDRNYNPRARKQVDANESSLNTGASSSIRGRKLGNSTTVEPSSPQFKPLEGEGKLLVILVEFSDTPYTWTPAGGSPRTAAGPLHNRIPVPDNTFDFWVPDFNQKHYQDMLFRPGGWTMPADAPRYAGEHFGSMRDYYLEQSYGAYTVTGDTYGWFRVDKPEAYYGDDDPAGGEDNLSPGTPATLIADAVSVINAQGAIDWPAYDANGDCIIDHPLFIHAGVDQSAGGGAQGDDSIWAHSSSVNLNVGSSNGACADGYRIENYTMMPEDGGIGVFAHEFGHDLGLPDEYDTIYSGRGDSVAFWSLMSSGSWLGRPAQTQPSDISIWGRYVLGWVKSGDNLTVVDLADIGKSPLSLRLEQAERWGGGGTINAIRINLPDKYFYINTPYSGNWEWFGGKADQIDTTLRRRVDLTGKTSATLSFWTWYDIEPGWDFGFVQVSTDGGATWKSLPLQGTTSSADPGAMPTIVANLPGFTGKSGGWVQKTYDLKDYLGRDILLQFRYMTDWGTTMAGFYVDDISVTTNEGTLFLDTVETLDSAWTANGWTRDHGSGSKPQYYMLEWRNSRPMETPYNDTTIVNSDAGLRHVYQFDPYGSTGNVNEPFWFPYSTPGMLLWYRDLTYTDNWTGVHPGGGFLLVVDAHDQAMLRAPYLNYGTLPWNTRVQSYDATFGLQSAPTVSLGYWGVTRTYSGLNALPNFDDKHTYWSSNAPDASVKTPTFGLLIRVLGLAQDGSAALIGLGTK